MSNALLVVPSTRAREIRSGKRGGIAPISPAKRRSRTIWLVYRFGQVPPESHSTAQSARQQARRNPAPAKTESESHPDQDYRPLIFNHLHQNTPRLPKPPL